MPRRGQSIDIPFASGQDDNVDDRLVTPPVLEDVKNAVYRKQGQIRQIPGNSLVASLPSSDTPVALFNYFGSLGAVSDQGVRFYDRDSDEFDTTPSAFPFTSVDERSQVREPGNPTSVDSAVNGNILCVVWDTWWRSSRGKGAVRCALYDRDSGSVVEGPVDLPSGDEGSAPRVQPLGGDFVIAYLDGIPGVDGSDATLNIAITDLSSSTSLPTSTSHTVASAVFFDIHVDDELAVVVGKTGTYPGKEQAQADILHVLTYDNTLTETRSTTYDVATTDGYKLHNSVSCYNNSGRSAVEIVNGAYDSGGGQAMCEFRSYTKSSEAFTSPLTVTFVSGSVSDDDWNYHKNTIAPDPDDNTKLWVCTSLHTSGGHASPLLQKAETVIATVESGAVSKKSESDSMVVASKLHRDTGHLYVVVSPRPYSDISSTGNEAEGGTTSDANGPQSANFPFPCLLLCTIQEESVNDWEGGTASDEYVFQPLARLLHDRAAKVAGPHDHLASLYKLSDALAFTGVILQQVLEAGFDDPSDPGEGAFLTGGDFCRVTLDDFAGSSAEGAGTALFAGGLVSYTDGQKLEEQVAAWPPEIVGWDERGSGDDMSGSVHEFQCTLVWRDAQNKEHRGPFGRVYKITYQAGITPADPVYVSGAPPSSRHQGMEVEVYARLDGGAWSLAGTAPTTTDFITVETTNIDNSGNVEGRGGPYTDGDVLAAEPPPALAYVTDSGDRLYGVSARNDDEVLFTKKLVQALSPEWNGNLTQTLPARGGKTMGIASLDGKPIAFKEHHIFALTGDGPNNLGLGPSLRVAEVTSHIGCRNSRSIIRTPLGIMFESERGIHLLDRSLQVQFIGGPVEDLHFDPDGTRLTINSAVWIPDNAEVRWLFDQEVGQTQTTARCLIFNLAQNRWSYTDNITDAVHSVYWDGDHTWLQSDGEVRQETDGEIPTNHMEVTTAWIKPGALQGYERVRRAVLLGEHTGTGDGGLTVRVATDYDDETWDDTRGDYSWTESQVDTVRRGNSLQLGFAPKKQKVESMRFRFEAVTVAKGDTPSPAELTGVTPTAWWSMEDFEESPTGRVQQINNQVSPAANLMVGPSKGWDGQESENPSVSPAVSTFTDACGNTINTAKTQSVGSEGDHEGMMALEGDNDELRVGELLGDGTTSGSATDFHMFFVFIPNEGNDDDNAGEGKNYRLLGSAGNDNYWALELKNGTELFCYFDDYDGNETEVYASTTYTITNDQLHVLELWQDNSDDTLHLKLDGADERTLSVRAWNAAGSMYFSAERTLSSASFGVNAEFVELVTFNEALSSSDRTDLERYYLDKYCLADEEDLRVESDTGEGAKLSALSLEVLPTRRPVRGLRKGARR